ncbi:MAG: zinc ribbon domain-containing protein [Lachnospiraceae bacterium]|nr:zinc ribbon domain-containing protein [Lachnospiraceae bacterium]
MFCTNCGKEIEGNVKFCPECGAPVSKGAESVNDRGEEKSVLPKPGICGTGDYEQLRQMTQKAGKTKKKAEIIIMALILVYAFVMVRGLLRMFQAVLEGRQSSLYFLISVLSIILVTCGLLYFALDIILPVLQKKKSVHAEEYLKYIQVNDRRALMHALGQMKCSMVKSVYMDEHGDVCVAGKKSKHLFTVQDSTPVMASKKDHYKAVLERETIAACLLKFVVPEAPVNAYENEKSNTHLSRMKLLIAVVATVSCLLLIVFGIAYETNNSYIKIVKNGHPELYPDITYGKAFEAFFGDCKWEYFESEDGKSVVEFNGNCLYGNDKATVTIQFLVNADQNTFEVYTAGIDGEEQPALVYSLLLLKVFESYGGSGEKGNLQLEDLENDQFSFAEQDDGLVFDENEAVTYTENETDDEIWPTSEITEDTNDFDAWMAELNDIVYFESIYHMSGLWSDGNIEVSISIYTDAEQYTSYDEVGTCFYGEIMGTLYFLGSDDTSYYLMGELAQGDVFILQYWGTEEINIIDASEGLSSRIGTTLLCEEHYES